MDGQRDTQKNDWTTDHQQLRPFEDSQKRFTLSLIKELKITVHCTLLTWNSKIKSQGFQ